MPGHSQTSGDRRCSEQPWDRGVYLAPLVGHGTAAASGRALLGGTCMLTRPDQVPDDMASILASLTQEQIKSSTPKH